MPCFRLLAPLAAFAIPASSQPQVVHAPYDEDTALTYASMAVASFCGHPRFPDDSVLEAWRCGPACDAVPDMQEVRSIQTPQYDNAFAFVGRRPAGCVVSFRGTDNLAGWLSDLQSARSVTLSSYGIPCEWGGKQCRVGYGFIDNYNRMREHMLGNLTAMGCQGQSVSVAGHSLGAAIAVVALFDLMSQGYSASDSYTFGQPRVGNSVFVNALNALLGDQARILRVTHARDPVPHLPWQWMGFVHHATEIYYGADTTEGYIVCDGTGEDQACADQWTSATALLATCVTNEMFYNDTRCDHMTYMAGSLPYSMGPESCPSPDGLGHQVVVA